jgi:hypothetical protein
MRSGSSEKTYNSCHGGGVGSLEDESGHCTRTGAMGAESNMSGVAVWTGSPVLQLAMDDPGKSMEMKAVMKAV